MLGPGREFDRIRAVADALGDAARGLGDDCAELPSASGTILVSTDVSVEHAHFERAWLRDEEIGWRAAMAALSDLAAMGARALGLVVAVTLPADAPEAELVALMRGIGEAASAVGAAVLGGDLAKGRELALAVTVFGEAAHPVRRSGARPGDEVWITGPLGGSRAALDALLAGLAPDPAARVRFARPEARIAAGQAIAALGATAMIDLSDGLAGDAGHIAAASGVCLELALDKLPVHPSARPAALAAKLPAEVYAAGSGEEYELLFTLPRTGSTGEIRRALAPSGAAPVKIGHVAEGGGVRITLDGRPVAVTGFDHFAVGG